LYDVEKRTALCIAKKCALVKNNILMQASEILPSISSFCGINPSVCVVLDVFSVIIKIKSNGKTGHVKIRNG
jgi:hypothetical protein